MTYVQSQKPAEELPNMHASVFATYNYSHYFCDSEVRELMDITMSVVYMINA